jgi:hypothetical protein
MYDVLSGTSALDDVMTEHLGGCKQCRSEMRWLEALFDFGRRESQTDPPEWALSNALKVFQLKRPSRVRLAKEFLASLIRDSFNDPLPVGVRRRDLPPRQTLYRAEGFQLDLKIQLSDDRGVIIGQILSEEAPPVDTAGLRVDLNQEGSDARSSVTNEWGEFMFEGLPHGNYEIEISLNDTRIRLPRVESDH